MVARQDLVLLEATQCFLRSLQLAVVLVRKVEEMSLDQVAVLVVAVATTVVLVGQAQRIKAMQVGQAVVLELNRRAIHIMPTRAVPPLWPQAPR